MHGRCLILTTRIGLIALAPATSLTPTTFAADPARDVRLQRIDGTTLDATWIGVSERKEIQVRRRDESLNIMPNELRRIIFRPKSPNRSSRVPAHQQTQGGEGTDSVLFHLADGGRLHGWLLEPPLDQDAVFSHTMLGEGVALPFDRLAGIQLANPEASPRAHDVFQDALRSRPPGHDLLITRDNDDVKKVQGRLERVGTTNGTFNFGGQSRTFQIEKIYGIVLAATASNTGHSRYSATFHLTDGSVVSGDLEGGNADSLRIKTSLLHMADLSIDDISRIDLVSDRVVSMSDLEPAAERVQGLVHRPWPIGRDRTTAGGPIRLGGSEFQRGLGVHARTELTYDLGGKYEKFASTIGLDDSVRPRGSVVFRVQSGDTILYDSGEITGMDDPRDVLVDVTGVDQLTLLVDFGSGLDVADHANWADARLLKPAQPRKKPTKGRSP